MEVLHFSKVVGIEIGNVVVELEFSSLWLPLSLFTQAFLLGRVLTVEEFTIGDMVDAMSM